MQNDILKEYIARGNYIFPPRPSMRLTTDLFAYCAERIPSWNTISISGYHIREAGSTAVQELAFTLANGIAYCAAAVEAGLSPDEFGARLSFFFNAHNDFFQEVAKFRAARRLWARIMRERFGATNPKALALRFHAQTGGSTLTAQQPENNIVRVAIQALSAVCGGAQSLHTNSFDEALALPTERAATIALRTQQILQTEAGTTGTADPLGGSYYIEALTDELEARAWELIERIDELGGAVAAVEQGFVQGEIEARRTRGSRQVESGERVIVGVNEYVAESRGADRAAGDRSRPPSGGSSSARRACAPSANADEAAAALERVREAARGTENLLPPMRDALRARCTIGEICGVLRDEWGEHDRRHDGFGSTKLAADRRETRLAHAPELERDAQPDRRARRDSGRSPGGASARPRRGRLRRLPRSCSSSPSAPARRSTASSSATGRTISSRTRSASASARPGRSPSPGTTREVAGDDPFAFTHPPPPKGTPKTLLLLGADSQLGRDEFLRILYGGRVSLEVAAGAAIARAADRRRARRLAGYFGGLATASSRASPTS